MRSAYTLCGRHPDASLNLSGGQLLIPYEAFFANPNGGKIDAGQGVFTLNTTVSSLHNAPTVNLNSVNLQMVIGMLL